MSLCSVMRMARSVLATGLLAALTSVVAATPSSALQTPASMIVDDDPVGWTPHVLDGRVMAITQIGNRMVAGGLFTKVQAADGTAVLTRKNIFAFDATTGAIDTAFAPNVDKEVSAVAPGPDGDSVFLGGVFTYVNGVRSKGVAKLSLADGQLVPGFKANTDNKVNDLKVMGNRVYIGGTFTMVGGVSRRVLAAVDAQTGAVDPNLNSVFASPRLGGNLSVAKFDITPDASKLVAVGNFQQVDGQVRYQLAVLDLKTVPAAVANWSTTRYQGDCASVFDTYLRDIDIAPDGTYFVIGTTGGYRRDTLCDTVTRWPLASTVGSGLQPTWIDYTGGDTTFSVAVTGNVVYVGGHQRWWNNPSVSNQAGPGAVPREGIAALDPVNGLPFSWNPGRTRGVGAFELTMTDAGLWVGSDTDRLAEEYHARIGFLPLFRGTTLPATLPATLPRDLYSATRGATPPVLHRVNAGGAALSSLDGGPSWAADTSTAPYAGHNSGGTTSSYSNVGSLNASVPATTPRAVFSSLRSDPSQAPEMSWDFPVAAGTQVQVQLYFANRSSQTNDPGERQFDVSIDGTLVLDNYDVVADVGHNTGVMKAFTRTSDGNIDLDFAHVRSDPMISAVEIIDVTPLPGADQLIKRAFDGATFGPPTLADSAATGGQWSHVRGAFMLNGRLYYGRDDGLFYARTFDGATLGAATLVDLHGLTSTHWRIANITGMFFDSGRIYYTLAGDARLLYRYFEFESDIVGASEFVASANGFDWRNTAGMTMASGRLYYGATDGNLRSVAFTGGAPVAGTPAVVSGPAAGDGLNWYTQELFVFHADGGVLPVPNAPPVAAVASSCVFLGCTFDASASTDTDGGIVSYQWDFGDGTTVTGVIGAHSFAAGGTYNVRLTVTDSQGAIAVSTRQLTVAPEAPNLPPTAAFTASCVDWSCTFNAAASTDSDGTVVSYSWDFGDGGTDSGPTPAHAFAADGTYPVALTVTDDDGAPGTTTEQVAVGKATAVAFRAATNSNTNAATHRVTVPAAVRNGDGLLLFASMNNSTVTMGEPTGGGWAQVQTATVSGITTRVWQKVAAAEDAGSTVTLALSGTGKVDLTLAAYSGTDLVAPVELTAAAVETVIRSDHTTPSVVVGNPDRLILSYWSDKSAATSEWTPPQGQTVRSAAYGTGGGRMSSLVTDGGGPQPPGTYGPLTALADSASGKATMWTIVLRPRA